MTRIEQMSTKTNESSASPFREPECLSCGAHFLLFAQGEQIKLCFDYGIMGWLVGGGVVCGF